MQDYGVFLAQTQEMPWSWPKPMIWYNTRCQPDPPYFISYIKQVFWGKIVEALQDEHINSFIGKNMISSSFLSMEVLNNISCRRKFTIHKRQINGMQLQIAKFMGPTWGPPGSCRPQMVPMLAPWTLLSGSCLKQVCWWWHLSLDLAFGVHIQNNRAIWDTVLSITSLRVNIISWKICWKRSFDTVNKFCLQTDTVIHLSLLCDMAIFSCVKTFVEPDHASGRFPTFIERFFKAELSNIHHTVMVIIEPFTCPKPTLAGERWALSLHWTMTSFPYVSFYRIAIAFFALCHNFRWHLDEVSASVLGSRHVISNTTRAPFY